MNRRSKSAQHKTRRAVKRCPFVASAEVIELGSGTKLSARTSEIGLGGCYIDALNPFPDGTLVSLRILRDQGVFEAKGKWSTATQAPAWASPSRKCRTNIGYSWKIGWPKSSAS